MHQVYCIQIYGDIHLGWVGDLLEMKFMFGLSAEAIMGKAILFGSSNQAKAQRSLKSVVSGSKNEEKSNRDTQFAVPALSLCGLK